MTLTVNVILFDIIYSVTVLCVNKFKIPKSNNKYNTVKPFSMCKYYICIHIHGRQ